MITTSQDLFTKWWWAVWPMCFQHAVYLEANFPDDISRARCKKRWPSIQEEFDDIFIRWLEMQEVEVGETEYLTIEEFANELDNLTY